MDRQKFRYFKLLIKPWALNNNCMKKLIYFIQGKTLLSILFVTLKNHPTKIFFWWALDFTRTTLLQMYIKIVNLDWFDFIDSPIVIWLLLMNLIECWCRITQIFANIKFYFSFNPVREIETLEPCWFSGSFW